MSTKSEPDKLLVFEIVFCEKETLTFDRGQYLNSRDATPYLSEPLPKI